MNPIQSAIEISGSVKLLSHSLGVTPQAVCFWRDGERKIPADKCPLIERLTLGVVRCEVLRPDVEWGYIRGTSAGMADSGAPALEVAVQP